jgi:hypothetical protein
MRLVSLVVATLFLCLSPMYSQSYATSDAAVSVTLADFDRDGYPDMAVLVDGGAVDIFFNDHKGGFGNYTSYAVPGSGTILAVDLNDDGWPDLLISGGSAVLLNNGNGTFRMGTPLVTKGSVEHFVAGDFNKDGKVDLAAVEGKQIEILLNKGDGTFTSGQILTLSGGSSNAVIGDFDGDGNLDIANSEGNKTLVWWGKGNGSFAAPLQILPPTTNGFDSLAVADFNNDGLPDLAGSSDYTFPDQDPSHLGHGTTTAHIYKNLGGRKFSLVSSYIMSSDYPQGILFTADVNGDLNQDLVNLINAAGEATGEVTYRPGNGAAGFGTLQQIGGVSAFEVAFRDLNLDSRQDLVIPQYFPNGEVDVSLAGGGFTNCKGASSASLNAKICAPANNATVSSPFLVTAAGNSPVGVGRLEIWVDGKKLYQKLGDQLNKKITLSSGRHRIAVVAVDKHVGSSSSVRYVNVQ